MWVKGIRGMHRYVGLAVIAYNLRRIGQILLERDRKSAEQGTEWFQQLGLYYLTFNYETFNHLQKSPCSPTNLNNAASLMPGMRIRFTPQSLQA